MSAATVRGNNLPQLQQEIWDFDPIRGYIHYQTWRGASQAWMLAQQQGYVRSGIACRLIYHQGDTATLEIDDSSQTYVIDSWEMVGNDEARDGLSHPSLILGLVAASEDPEKVISVMRKNLAEETDPTVLFGTGGDLNGKPTICQEFYRLQMRGSTEYRRAQYVLRHKTNAPNVASPNIADFNVDAVYSPSSFLTEIASALLWAFPCPSYLLYRAAHIPAPAAIANYNWGWLKSNSTTINAPHNRIEICQEYVLEQWSSDYYPVYV